VFVEQNVFLLCIWGMLFSVTLEIICGATRLRVALGLRGRHGKLPSVRDQPLGAEALTGLAHS